MVSILSAYNRRVITLVISSDVFPEV